MKLLYQILLIVIAIAMFNCQNISTNNSDTQITTTTTLPSFIGTWTKESVQNIDKFSFSQTNNDKIIINNDISLTRIAGTTGTNQDGTWDMSPSIAAYNYTINDSLILYESIAAPKQTLLRKDLSTDIKGTWESDWQRFTITSSGFEEYRIDASSDWKPYCKGTYSTIDTSDYQGVITLTNTHQFNDASMDWTLLSTPEVYKEYNYSLSKTMKLFDNSNDFIEQLNLEGTSDTITGAWSNTSHKFIFTDTYYEEYRKYLDINRNVKYYSPLNRSMKPIMIRQIISDLLRADSRSDVEEWNPVNKGVYTDINNRFEMSLDFVYENNSWSEYKKQYVFNGNKFNVLTFLDNIVNDYISGYLTITGSEMTLTIKNGIEFRFTKDTFEEKIFKNEQIENWYKGNITFLSDNISLSYKQFYNIIDNLWKDIDDPSNLDKNIKYYINSTGIVIDEEQYVTKN